MIAAVSKLGEVRWMCYTSTMTQSLFILFLARLAQSEGRPITVITDNLRDHHGKRLTAWLEETEYDINLEFIPTYSPEVNPVEYLNRDLKKNVNSKRMPSDLNELKEHIVSFMRPIQKRTERAIHYLSGRHVAFAK